MTCRKRSRAQRDRTPFWVVTGLWIATGLSGPVRATPAQSEARIAPHYFNQVIRPLTVEYCFRCHSAAKHKGDVNLERFTSLDLAMSAPGLWQRVIEELQEEEMPPDEAPRHPSDVERETLQNWATEMIDKIALQRAGDPGPVVLRRLSNAEYTYTIRELTGVESLNPLKEFPEDGAAGEGFTNTGQALVMSPILLAKYLEAAKGIASHAILLPDGIRFSSKSNRYDWSGEIETRIRDFYRRFAELPPENGKLNEHTGQETFVSSPSENGRLPLEKYMRATLEERAALRSGAKTSAEVARERGLSRKYLALLWGTLTGTEPSPLLDPLRAEWRAAKPGDAAVLLAYILPWQEAMWKFGNVGQLDQDGRAKRWMQAVRPLVEEQELRLKIPSPSSGDEISIFASTGDAGDGKAGDLVEWRQARLIRPGKPAIPLRDVRSTLR